MDSVRSQAGMLSVLVSQTDEVTRNSEVIKIELNEFQKQVYKRIYLKKDIVMNQCIRLVNSLQSFVNVRPVDEVKKAIVGIWSVVGYVRLV
jgi:hypothetical protein